MPVVTCQNCKKNWLMSNRELQLLFYGELPVCSSKCLVQFIQNSPKTEENNSYCSHTGDLGGNIWSEIVRMMFKSRFEAKIAEILYENQIKFEYEQYLFHVGTTVYVPDLYLPEYDMFLEVKGAWGVGSKNKLAQFFNDYPTTKLTLIPWVVGEGLIEPENSFI